jgi:selenocysteine-specific elongation factor
VERHVVVGTAGHIDHGKTTLVRALTGVDTDRLAEEKARGITIDLGFAPLELGGDLAASVVDVPGHEAFVRNMVAGATGVDLALLVVAADEGVMPQTREHLAILRLLGVARGVVALTKCDLAPDPAWRQLVAEDVRALVAAPPGQDWPIVEVAAQSGLGIEDLRAAVRSEAAHAAARSAQDRFRLPVDRVFALPGAGTIVTGTVWSGSVAEGEHVLVLPARVEARVRSVQVHGRAAPRAEPGRRTAIALVGLAKEQAARGAVVVGGAGWRASSHMDVALAGLPGVAFRPRMRVRIHHGTAEVMARITRLGEASGGRVPARLALEQPLVARCGDRFVMRSFSPVATIGGGEVVEPWAADGPRRGRGVAPALPAASDGERVERLVRRRGAAGLSLVDLEVAAGLDRPRLEAACDAAAASGILLVEQWLVGREEVDAGSRRLQETLERWHLEQPLEPGMPAQAWRGSYPARAELIALAEGRLVAAGQVERHGALVRRPGFDPSAAAGAVADQARVLEALAAAGGEPPSVSELQATLPAVKVAAVLRMLARAGRAVAVGPDRYYEAAALAAERGRLEGVLEELGAASPAQIRDRLGRSRKWLIPLLEWADREGVTVRDGDRRRLKVQGGT